MPDTLMPLTLQSGCPRHRSSANQIRRTSSRDGVAATSAGRFPSRLTTRAGHRRRVPVKGASPAMPGAPDVVHGIAGAPRPPRQSRGIGTGYSAGTPSRTTSLRAPRQGSPKMGGARRRPRTGQQTRRTEVRSHRGWPHDRGRTEPEGPRLPQAEPTHRCAKSRRRCVRSTSAIHMSKTSTVIPPGCGDHSPRVARFTPRGPLRPPGLPTGSPIRRARSGNRSRL